MLVDPFALDFKLLGREADRAEYAEPTRVRNCRNDIATVRENGLPVGIIYSDGRGCGCATD